MGELSFFITIWAAVGASGLGAGGLGVYMTRRRFRLSSPAGELDVPVEEMPAAA